MSNSDEPSDFTVAELPNNPYSLGIVLRFLADHQPFSEFEFGPTTKSILYQMQANSYFVCIKNDQIAGYLGWIRTTDDNGRAWLEEGTPLVPNHEATAIAVTIFAASERRFIRPMIRYAKKREPGLTVYWKRYYQDGRTPTHKIVEVE